MFNKLAIKLALTAAAVVVFTGSAGANQPAAAERTPFFDSLDVNVSSLEVVALDAQQHRVTDLGRDELRLYEDGQPVPIDYFYQVSGAPASEPAGAASAEPLHVVIYVDDFNLRPEGRRHALEQLKSFLAGVPLADADYMVVTYDQALHVRQAPTRDLGKVADALTGVEKVSAQRHLIDRERLDLLESLAGRPPVLRCSLDGSAELRLTVESLANDLDRSLDALSRLVGSLAGMPGRKALVYLSDGLPMRPGEDLYYAFSQRCLGSTFLLSDVQSYDASLRFSDLAADANANRVSLYTFQASGSWRPTFMTAEHNLPFLPEIDGIYATNLQSSLQYLASATGGLAVVDTNDLEPGFQAMADDLTAYYSLGFTPQPMADGRHHHFRVETTRPGVRLRYANGYHAKTLDQRLAEATRSALLFGNGGNQLQARLERGAPDRVKTDRFMVPVRLTIPARNLDLQQANGGYEGTLRVLIAAADASGRTSALRENLVPVHFKASPRGDFTWETSLLMRGGEQTVALGVEDEASHSTAILASTFTVG